MICYFIYVVGYLIPTQIERKEVTLWLYSTVEFDLVSAVWTKDKN